jgi:nucleotide-binding universal stress UspA family protein
MKRILVPTDFSPTAEKAFRFALDLAKKAKGTVILYHTYLPVESTFVGTEKSRTQYNAQAEANIAKRLQRLKKKVTGDAAEVTVSTVVGRSPLIDNILGFAEHNHIDLIIMGTQGASGLKKTIIGSVAARVLEKSDLPVLLVPSKYELEEPRKFVFATNYQPADKQALTMIEAMSKLYNADITVLHFLSAYTAESDKVKERNDFDTYAFAIQRDFNGSNLKFHLLETLSVTETMETLDKKFPYDIMAMVRRKKTFLERFFIKSFTQNMAYVTKKPLLVIPEEE